MRPKLIVPAALALMALGVVGIVLLAGNGSDGDEGSGDPSGDQAVAPTREVYPSEYSNLYTVDVGTRSVKNLTHFDDDEVVDGPSWSPQGKIVFTKAPSDEELTRLFVIDEDGSRRREAPTRISHLFQPAWSPDGNSVAAVKLGSGIFEVNPRSGTARPLTRNGADDAPDWSPDGKSVVFQRQVTASNWDLFVVDVASGRLRRVTNDPLQQVNPTWSPDGKRIAFAEQQKNGNWAIFSADPAGADRRQLTSEERSSQEPAWSHDGKKIAFLAQDQGAAAVAVVGADGGTSTRITSGRLICSAPAWSPDGKRIVFVARESLSAKEAASSEGNGKPEP